MKIEVGDLVKSNDYIDPNVYLFGLVVGFHEIDAPHRPFKIEWFHKEDGWTLCDDFWYDDELELAE